MNRPRSLKQRSLTYPVWVVLIVVVLFPVFGLTKGVVDEGLESKAAAREAAELQETVRAVTSLQLMDLLLLTNQMSEVAILSIELAGLDLEFVFGGGADPGRTLQQIRQSRLEVQRARSELQLGDPDGPSAVLGQGRLTLKSMFESLDAVYEELDARTAETDDLTEVVEPLRREVVRLSEQAMGSVRSELGSSSLERDLRAIDALLLSLEASIGEMVAVGALLFPGEFNYPGLSEPASQAAASHAIARHEREQFQIIAPPRLLASWQELTSGEDPKRLAELRTNIPRLLGLTQEEARSGFDPVEYFGLVLIEMETATNELIPSLLTSLAADLDAIEVELEDEAQRSFIEAIVWLLVTMAVVILASRLLLRPLRRASARAKELTSGTFGDDELGPMGPREINDVGVALDAAHESLHLLRDQLQALADKRLDAPVLDTRVAGPIGEYVSASVSSLSEATSLLHEQANQDRLTGLPNRSASVDLLERMATDALPSARLGVIFLDLDRFKAANDSYGHAVGDHVLQIASQRFEAVLAEGGHEGFVGRLGGDEFLVACSGIRTEVEAMSIAARLVESMSAPISVAAIEVHVGASAGVTTADGTEVEASELLYESDLALYASKATGEQVSICTQELKERAAEQRLISEMLGAALGSGDVELHLQPLVDLETTDVVAGEALLRWTHKGEFMSPGWYIPLIESSPLIVDVGRWVLGEASRMARYVAAECGTEIPISVNISWNHVTSGSLVSDVAMAIEAAGIKPSQLRLELTETSPPNDIERAAEVLTRVRDLGVSLWLDDFGTGFTSITQLREFAFDVIKLDRSFVAGPSDSGAAGLADALIEIARLVDVDVIAEGVEEQHESDRMLASGCTWGQGWLWSKALSLGDFVKSVSAPSWQGSGSQSLESHS